MESKYIEVHLTTLIQKLKQNNSNIEKMVALVEKKLYKVPKHIAATIICCDISYMRYFRS